MLIESVASGAAAKGLVYTAGTVPNATVIGTGIANETVSLDFHFLLKQHRYQSHS